METQDESLQYLMKLSGGLVVIIISCTILALGTIIGVQALGTSNSLKWFLGPFIGFFFGTLGFLYLVNRLGIRKRE
ncbi:MAG: hypothetical protein ACMUHY_07860 [Thermoplasmatota archaeon]